MSIWYDKGFLPLPIFKDAEVTANAAAFGPLNRNVTLSIASLSKAYWLAKSFDWSVSLAYSYNATSPSRVITGLISGSGTTQLQSGVISSVGPPPVYASGPTTVYPATRSAGDLNAAYYQQGYFLLGVSSSLSDLRAFTTFPYSTPIFSSGAPCLLPALTDNWTDSLGGSGSYTSYQVLFSWFNLIASYSSGSTAYITQDTSGVYHTRLGMYILGANFFINTVTGTGYTTITPTINLTVAGESAVVSALPLYASLAPSTGLICSGTISMNYDNFYTP